MAWGVFTYIFGAICIIGPLCLIYWYWKAAKQKFQEFSAAAAAGDVEAQPPNEPGEGA